MGTVNEARRIIFTSRTDPLKILHQPVMFSDITKRRLCCNVLSKQTVLNTVFPCFSVNFRDNGKGKGLPIVTDPLVFKLRNHHREVTRTDCMQVQRDVHTLSMRKISYNLHFTLQL